MAIEYRLEDAIFPIQFRPMQIDDIAAVCEIEQEAFQLPWTSEAFRNEIINNQFAKYLVLEIQGELIGYVGMWLIIDEAHITNIAIKKQYRGNHLGTQLLMEMQRIAFLSGAKHMTLEVRTSNQVAQHVYKKLGFKFMGVRKGYYSDNGEDAHIMWSDLANRNKGSLVDDDE